jgi:hypothetical protein
MPKAKKDTLKKSSQKRLILPSSGASDVPLSPQWAFLIQFRAVPGGPAYVAGRVEHLKSGRTSYFQSLKELTRYFDKELHATDKA